LNLDDTGTRYTHYRELLDLWENSLEILKYNQIYYSLSSAIEIKKQLENAVFVLTKQLEIISDYNVNISKIANEVDKINTKNLLTTGNNDDIIKK
jgi:hypothetical protein